MSGHARINGPGGIRYAAVWTRVTWSLCWEVSCCVIDLCYEILEQ